MAGTLTTTTVNKLLDSLNLKTIKLHSQDPTENGTAGVITGAEATFSVNQAANGAIASAGSTEIDINVPSGSITVAYYSLWDSSDTPVCVATGALSSSQTYTASGKYVVNTLTVDLNK